LSQSQDCAPIDIVEARFFDPGDFGLNHRLKILAQMGAGEGRICHTLDHVVEGG